MNPPAHIADYLVAAAARHPERLALVSPQGRLSLRELDALSDIAARGLVRLGLKKDSRVVLMVRPGPEFLVLAFGLVKMGAVMVVVDPGMGWANLGKCLDEAAPEAFVGIPLAHVARILFRWASRTTRRLVTVGSPKLWGGISFAALMKSGASPSSSADGDELAGPGGTAAIVFTSGSTGVPKGVVYTHRMFAAQVELLRRHFGIQEGEVDLATFPLFGLFDPAWGATTVFPEMDFSRPGSADPAKIVRAIEENQVTHMFGSPALLDRVGRYGLEKGVKLPSLRRVLSAGAPVSPKILKRFSGILSEGVQVHTPYGATEALPVSSIGGGEALAENETGTARGLGVCVGQPLPGVSVAIIPISDQPVDSWSDDLPLPAGEIGEVAVWGENVSDRYIARPEANRLAKIAGPDGRIVHRMGDLGWIDQRGRLWFCGRKSQRVTTSQDTIFSVACEGIFNQHPEVYRTALVGLGDAPGQVPVLCVELEDKGKWKGSQELGREILALGEPYPQARRIAALLFHPKFPVDVRHNAKIHREKLAVWAASRLRSAKLPEGAP